MVQLINKLLKHQGVKKYGSNTLWMLFEKCLRLGVGLFVGVWVARYLGPERLGVLSFAQTYVTLFSAFAFLGLDGIVVRELVKSELKKEVVLGSAGALKLLASLVVVCFVLASTQLKILSEDESYAIAVLSLILILQSSNIIEFYFQSVVKSKFVVFSNIFTICVSSIVKVVLIINECPVIYFVYALVFDAAVLCLLLFFFYVKRSNIKLASWKVEKAVMICLLKQSWPVIFSGLLISIYMRIDQIMLKFMLGPTSVGIYAAAVRLSELWYFIPVVICSSLFPAIVSAKQSSSKAYHNRISMLFAFMFWSAVALALVVAALSGTIVELLYGTDYMLSGDVLYYHIWATVFVAVGVVNSNYLLTEGLQRLSLVGAIFGAISNIALNYLLISSYGVVGSAVATLISFSLSSLLFLLVFDKYRYIVIEFIKAVLFFRRGQGFAHQGER